MNKSVLQEHLPNPFAEGDAARDKLEYLEQELERIKTEHSLLMSIVTMLARAEEFRIKKHVDKISG